jgi:hypothetical protein
VVTNQKYYNSQEIATVSKEFEWSGALKEEKVGSGQLYLDPNNPRYADITNTLNKIPADRITDETVQNKALERMLDERFEVKQLKDSIHDIGFLSVDRLVVTPLPAAGKYLVVEGNRRLAAIKSLLQDEASGEIQLDSRVKDTLSSFPVAVISAEDQEQRDYIARVMQGVRHLAGIKPWGPYQQGMIVALMLDDGRDLSEVCDTLGLTSRRANQLRRAYYAMQQMKQDDDFAEYVKPSFFSYFDEVFKAAKVRDWLGWNDDKNLFENTENRKQLYTWIVGEDINGEQQTPKLVDPKEVRDLRDLMEDPVQFKRFCETPTLSITDALKGITRQTTIDWRGILANNLTVLNQIPAVDFVHASDDDVNLLKKLLQVCQTQLTMIDTLKKAETLAGAHVADS